MRFLLVNLLCAVSSFAMCAAIDFKAFDTKDNALEILRLAATKYIQNNTTEEENKIWQKKWQERLKDAEKQEESEEKYTVRIVQTYLEGHTKAWKDATPNKEVLVEACRYFLLVLNNNYALPTRITERLTVENAKKAAEYLEKH